MRFFNKYTTQLRQHFLKIRSNFDQIFAGCPPEIHTFGVPERKKVPHRGKAVEGKHIIIKLEYKFRMHLLRL